MCEGVFFLNIFDNKTLVWSVGLSVSAVLVCFIILGCVKIIYTAIQKKKEQKKLERINLVKEISPRYKALIELNNSYSFHKKHLKETYEAFWNVNTKSKFDRFNFDTNFSERIASRIPYFEKMISLTEENYNLFQKYSADLQKIPDYATKESVEAKSVRHYVDIEHELCEEIVLHPVIKIKYVCTVTYNSPQGRNSYTNHRQYNAAGIKNLMRKISEAEKIRNTKDYERSLMTDSLRYEIMKRDNFRCVLCGRSADDGIKLHVDHIKPVSKGGKTEYNNLRTLCDQCNFGKSDKWDEYGLN